MNDYYGYGGIETPTYGGSANSASIVQNILNPKKTPVPGIGTGFDFSKMFKGLGGYLSEGDLAGKAELGSLLLKGYDSFYGPGAEKHDLLMETGREQLDALRQARSDTDKFNKMWSGASKNAGLAAQQARLG